MGMGAIAVSRGLIGVRWCLLVSREVDPPEIGPQAANERWDRPASGQRYNRHHPEGLMGGVLAFTGNIRARSMP